MRKLISNQVFYIPSSYHWNIYLGWAHTLSFHTVMNNMFWVNYQIYKVNVP